MKSSSHTFYRSEKKSRIVADLQANSSVLVIGEPGCGKSTLRKSVAFALQDLGFKVVVAMPNASKQMLKSIAEDLGIDTKTIEGKAMTCDRPVFEQ